MAGKITVSTINDSSGVLATQNGMTGIAKAWVNYNAGTQTINASFNISSVTYGSVGNYTLNFTTAMPSANYAWSGGSGLNNANQNQYVTLPRNVALTTSKTTTTLQVQCVYANLSTVNVDSDNLSVIVIGA